MGMTQDQFSAVMGIKLATLRNWEQKRRKPERPAQLLLRIAAKHPEIVMSVVQESVHEYKPRTARKSRSRSKTD
jgi:putative transcriptional regulator